MKKVRDPKFPNSILYKKDDVIYFNLNEKEYSTTCKFWFLYNTLKMKFRIKEFRIKYLLKYALEKYLKKQIFPMSEKFTDVIYKVLSYN